ncbi:hypothetical protein PR048_009809 [Dryococelus australis]|uniref:Uncharacterized protein n=1 Tax=Dryococelus australis TaxID=614101 RepID=A0ABQ9I1Q3_9NEOP|nr:hypothetical protein PR048_009809 [Dryococelus australis]
MHGSPKGVRQVGIAHCRCRKGCRLFSSLATAVEKASKRAAPCANITHREKTLPAGLVRRSVRACVRERSDVPRAADVTREYSHVTDWSALFLCGLGAMVSLHHWYSFLPARAPRGQVVRPILFSMRHVSETAGWLRIVVAERIACLPPTEANRIRTPVGSLPDFRAWESCRTMPLVGGFLSEIPRFPHSCVPALLHAHINHPHQLSRPRCQEPHKSLRSLAYSKEHNTRTTDFSERERRERERERDRESCTRVSSTSIHQVAEVTSLQSSLHSLPSLTILRPRVACDSPFFDTKARWRQLPSCIPNGRALPTNTSLPNLPTLSCTTHQSNMSWGVDYMELSEELIEKLSEKLTEEQIVDQIVEVELVVKVDVDVDVDVENDCCSFYSVALNHPSRQLLMAEFTFKFTVELFNLQVSQHCDEGWEKEKVRTSPPPHPTSYPFSPTVAQSLWAHIHASRRENEHFTSGQANLTTSLRHELPVCSSQQKRWTGGSHVRKAPPSQVPVVAGGQATSAFDLGTAVRFTGCPCAREELWSKVTSATHSLPSSVPQDCLEKTDMYSSLSSSPHLWILAANELTIGGYCKYRPSYLPPYVVVSRNSATHSLINSNSTPDPEACRNIYSVALAVRKVQRIPSHAERTRSVIQSILQIDEKIYTTRVSSDHCKSNYSVCSLSVIDTQPLANRSPVYSEQSSATPPPLSYNDSPSSSPLARAGGPTTQQRRMQGRVKRVIPEKTHQQAALSSRIPIANIRNPPTPRNRIRFA